MSHASLERYIATVLNRRTAMLALVVATVLAASAGLPGISMTHNYEVLFSEDNPERLALDALENTYTDSNRALIAIAPKEGSVFTRETLAAFVELTDAAWQAPYSTRVDSLTNFFHSEASGDDLRVEPLVRDAEALSDAELARVEAIALNEPDIAGRLVAHDGRVGGVAITFALPDASDPAVLEITGYLDTLLADLRELNPSLDYYVTGDVLFNRAFARATTRTHETLTPFALLAIVLVSSLLLRSVWGTVAIVTVILSVLLTTLGVAGWMELMFSSANSGIPIILMVLTLAYTIHIVTDTLIGLRQGLDRDAAIAESLRVNTYPVFLTSITTAIGFLSLNSSEAPPFHVLGNFVALGVVWAYIYSMTLLPALLSIMPLRASRRPALKLDFFSRLADFVIAQRKPLMWGLMALTIALLAGIPRNIMTDNWTEYFDETYEFRRDTDFISSTLTGMNALEYSLDSGREGGITDPEYLQTVDAFANWYREQPEVAHVQAFPDTMKRLNKNMHGDDPTYYRLPDSQELAAQYLLLYEFSLPFGSNLNDRIDIAKSATRMTVTTKNVSTAILRDVDVRAQQWLQANAPSMAIPASGTSIIFAHISARNIESMIFGTGIALFIISLILIGVFRSLKYGLLSLLPNLLPAAVSFGLWGYLVGRIGMTASIVVIIAFSIIVDDTIHFMNKYLMSRRAGMNPSEAVHETFCTVGRALWTTTAVLCVGFLIYASSGFEMSRVNGLMVTTTLLFALAGDFLLLPALLMAIDRKKKL